MSGVRTTVKQKDVALHQYVQISTVAHTASYSVCTDVLPWVQQPWREVKLTSSAEIKNEWSYTSTPPICLRDAKGKFCLFNFFFLQAEILSTVN